MRGGASKKWPSVQGTVLESRVIERKNFSTKRAVATHSTIYEAHILYGYKVGNRSYTSNRICFGPPDEGAGELVKKYPVGKVVRVYYDPNDPGNSVLEPGSKTSGNLILIGLGIGVLLFFGMDRRRRKKLPKQRSPV